MQLYAPAKINWALDVTGKRPDGYHTLDMLMQTIDLYDTLALEPDASLSLSIVGDAPTQTVDENLVLRAARMLAQTYGVKEGARMRLTKRIPAGAGLGGGSADAAAALRGLNALWGLGRPLDELAALGLRLGADVPFCVYGGLARVKGIGEIVEPIAPGSSAAEASADECPAAARDHRSASAAKEADGSAFASAGAVAPWSLVVLWPGVALSTPRVFAAWDAQAAAGVHEQAVHVESAGLRMDRAQDALLARDVGALALWGNALETAAASLCQEVVAGVAQLRAAGALLARMSGSGSAVFGVFETHAQAEQAAAALRAAWPFCAVARTLGPTPQEGAGG